MNTKKTKEVMIPGKRYRGYAYLNEYKEFVFEPENTGARAGVIKSVTQRDGVSISHTRDYVLIHVKMKRMGVVALYMKELWSKFTTIINILKEYDI